MLKRRVKLALASAADRLRLPEALCRLCAGRAPSVHVLMYHRVSGGPPSSLQEPEITLSTATFAEQVPFLRERCRVVPLLSLLDNPPICRSRPVVALTFDDGWRDNYLYAWPLLREHSMPATVFLATGFIGTQRRLWSTRLACLWPALLEDAASQRWLGERLARAGVLDARRAFPQRLAVAGRLGRLSPTQIERLLEGLEQRLGPAARAAGGEPDFMTWAEVAEMAEGGVEMGAHTVNHCNLTAVAPDETAREVLGSRRAIEERLGRPAALFAYPGGYFGPDAVARVRDAGFRLAVTTEPGAWRHGTDPMAVPRVGVNEAASTDLAGRFHEGMFALEIAGVWRAARL